MAVFGTREPQACPTCGRTWDHRAAFCGACGDRLAGSLLGPRRTRDDTTTRTTPRWWHHPATGWTALAAVVATVAITVPTVTVERTDPVAGDIGVPESEQLTAVDADDPLVPPPEPPDLTCEHHGEPVDCILWSRATGTGRQVGLPVVTVATDDRLLVARPSTDTVAPPSMLALDAATGRRLWERDLRGVGLRAPLQVHGDEVVVHTETQVQMVSAVSGEEQWAAPDPRWSTTTLAGDHVYVQPDRPPDEDEQAGPGILARLVAGGRIAWRWTPEGPGTELPLFVSPVDGDHVLFQSWDGLVAVVETRTGTTAWSRSLPTPTRNSISPANLFTLVGDDTLVSVRRSGDASGTASDEQVVALDVTNGAERWRRDVPAGGLALRRKADTVVTWSGDRLVALDHHTGLPRWERPLDEREGPATLESPFPSPASHAPGLVVTTTPAGVVRARDAATGDLVWERALPDLSSTRSWIRDDHVLVDHGRGVTFLDLEDGARLVDVLGARLQPAPGSDTVLLAPTTGHLVRVDPTPGAAEGTTGQ